MPWLKLLPNLTWLDIDFTELKYWLDDETVGRDLHVFLERLEKFYVVCVVMDETTLEKFLTYFVESGHFSRVRQLRLHGCPRLSLSSDDIQRWTKVMSVRSSSHQVQFLKLDFFDEEYLIPGVEVGHTMETINEGQSITQVHRYVRPGYVHISLERWDA